ncbi:MAG TPA: bifunctional diaminohydroxyphosphoribosylaminopyrimidine deaminase/5-amino-6-(5-phosphoribosylamino)uracil reductase RibD [Chitinophagaceae bacterium]|nr:bifunctional diaminohydroxyphosphoribosylaminopyrimidine deaminase/5-amino-6-(5-phosphoribosylamino)uracil reductase RibD [Chitinophagaceae bacterium]
MPDHEFYMQRCLELAKKGAGSVAPNPMVGSVLVYQDRIIGEGWHQRFGEAHAEVNCISSVREEDQPLINSSVLYVSLEPCAHFGKTPPCTDLIIRHKIRQVVIACPDPFDEVNGKGIEKLKASGIDVITGVLEKEAMALNRRFFIFYQQHRPYIILKWAQTADHFMSREAGQPRLLISNELSNRLVHQWRSQESSILVGTATALADNPSLTTRLWPGASPLRLILDLSLRLPPSLHVFDQTVKTIIFNKLREGEEGNLHYYKISESQNLVQQLLHALYQLKIQSVMVEGGARLLQSFLNEGCWDEARVITNEHLKIEKGLAAPRLGNAWQTGEQELASDRIRFYTRQAK